MPNLTTKLPTFGYCTATSFCVADLLLLRNRRSRYDFLAKEYPDIDYLLHCSEVCTSAIAAATPSALMSLLRTFAYSIIFAATRSFHGKKVNFLSDTKVHNDGRTPLCT